jgi:small subunit ribosomal protein S19
MSRASWKGPFLVKSLIKSKLSRKIWSRSSAIPGALVGKAIYIHNGKKFKRIIIDRSKVGYKVGEFAVTRLLTSRKSKSKSKAPTKKGLKSSSSKTGKITKVVKKK